LRRLPAPGDRKDYNQQPTQSRHGILPESATFTSGHGTRNAQDASASTDGQFGYSSGTHHYFVTVWDDAVLAVCSPVIRLVLSHIQGGTA